jgi:hypothetical protein
MPQSSLTFAYALFGKPVPTFPEHALRFERGRSAIAQSAVYIGRDRLRSRALTSVCWRHICTRRLLQPKIDHSIIELADGSEATLGGREEARRTRRN